mgnify:CR=1 FL=1
MWLYALAGGGLIGLAATLLFLTHGRIAGVSGIYGSFLPPVAHDLGWRLAFIGGLVLSGVVAAVLAPSAIGAAARSTWVLAVAGLLVGFGSSMGSGCTSGHGVCGLARASARSLVAVMTFMTTGAVTAWLAGGV